jgi:hypothetical protein
MKTLRANLRYWIVGALVAFTGVLLARIIATFFDGPMRPVLTVAGQLLAPGGLYIICHGIRRRIQAIQSTETPSRENPLS